MCRSMVDIQSTTAEIRRGKKNEISWVSQTNERISHAIRPKFTILGGRVGEILFLNNFFSDSPCMP